MGFNERRFGDVTILDLAGRLTYTSGSAMNQRIRGLAGGGPEGVVLNLEEVSYIDSAGLGAVVEAFTTLRHRGGALKLLNPTKRTVRLLEITGLASIVATFHSESAALASFATGPA
jgi:anti-sigma B factor antagonist